MQFLYTDIPRYKSWYCMGSIHEQILYNVFSQLWMRTSLSLFTVVSFTTAALSPCCDAIFWRMNPSARMVNDWFRHYLMKINDTFSIFVKVIQKKKLILSILRSSSFGGVWVVDALRKWDRHHSKVSPPFFNGIWWIWTSMKVTLSGTIAR